MSLDQNYIKRLNRYKNGNHCISSVVLCPSGSYTYEDKVVGMDNIYYRYIINLNER